MSLQTYQLVIRWRHIRFGPQITRLKQTAGSIRRAIANGLQAFFTEQRSSNGGRRDYLDAHKSIEIDAWRISGHRPGVDPKFRPGMKARAT